MALSTSAVLLLVLHIPYRYCMKLSGLLTTTFFTMLYFQQFPSPLEHYSKTSKALI